MSRDTHRHRAHRPVFVDASGRRQQGLRLAGAILVLPAVGYVVVLLSTLLGGPTVQSPLLPSPAAPLRAAAAAQHPGPVPTTVPTNGPAQVVGLTSTTAPTDLALTNPTPASTALPTSLSVPAPTRNPSATSNARGRPTSLPTPTNRPTKTAR